MPDTDSRTKKHTVAMRTIPWPTVPDRYHVEKKGMLRRSINGVGKVFCMLLLDATGGGHYL